MFLDFETNFSSLLRKVAFCAKITTNNLLYCSLLIICFNPEIGLIKALHSTLSDVFLLCALKPHCLEVQRNKDSGCYSFNFQFNKAFITNVRLLMLQCYMQIQYKITNIINTKSNN
jgi:hypothetical protein